MNQFISSFICHPARVFLTDLIVCTIRRISLEKNSLFYFILTLEELYIKGPSDEKLIVTI